MPRSFTQLQWTTREQTKPTTTTKTTQRTSRPKSSGRSKPSASPKRTLSSERSRSTCNAVSHVMPMTLTPSTLDSNYLTLVLREERRGEFNNVVLRTAAVIFFQTRAPIEPVSFVHRICADAVESSAVQRSRWVQRLTPMTLMGKATEKGLEDVARAVLAPHFHAQAQSESPKKVRRGFAYFLSFQSSVIPLCCMHTVHAKWLARTQYMHGRLSLQGWGDDAEANIRCGSRITCRSASSRMICFGKCRL